MRHRIRLQKTQRSSCRKVPANIVLTVFAATASKTCFDTSLGMKRIHRIEPLAEAIRRYSHLDDVRKLPSKGFGAWATFVACHRFKMIRSTGESENQLLYYLMLEPSFRGRSEHPSP